MWQIVLSSLELLKGVYEDLPEKGLMVAPPQIATQLLDWTDPQKAVHGETVKVDDLVHFDLAMDIVKDLLSKDAPSTSCLWWLCARLTARRRGRAQALLSASQQALCS